jgi:hypothetical protein
MNHLILSPDEMIQTGQAPKLRFSRRNPLLRRVRAFIHAAELT